MSERLVCYGFVVLCVIIYRYVINNLVDLKEDISCQQQIHLKEDIL